MSGSSNREHDPDDGADVDRQAAEWFALLLDDGATPTDRANFRAWLERNPAHATAYAELERLWLGASALPEVARPTSQTRRKILRSGGAFAVLTIAGAGSAIYLRSSGADYQTGIGETARFALPDGSLAELSTASAISLNFTAGQRQVILQQGEAFFTVAPDVSRPFIVDCGQLRSIALGTQFSVGMHDDGIVVGVVEHTVRVSSPTQGAGRPGGTVGSVCQREAFLADPDGCRHSSLMARWKTRIYLDALRGRRCQTLQMAARQDDRHGQGTGAPARQHYR